MLCQFYSGTVFLYICVYVTVLFIKEEEEEEEEEEGEEKERNSERKNYIIRLCKTKRVLVSIVERIKGSKKRARRSAEGDRVWKLVPQSSARWQERLAPSLRAAHGHFQGFTLETLVSPLIDSSL